MLGQVKSWTSARVESRGSRRPARFGWQEDYSVFSFDRRRLANLIAYVENQIHHHAKGTTIPLLERTSGGPVWWVQGLDAGYHVESEAWRKEMLALDTAFLEESGGTRS
ncbi:MAG: hypothetical protein HC802_16985 [Caldilineaceae bacterium]|nr:hypothetical protein [Caldilineaceae bacterium]